MNIYKVDNYIKEKVDLDNETSPQLEKMLKKFKEDLNMKEENKEKKVITIGIGKVLAIAACLILVAFLGVNIYSSSQGRPNVFSSIQGLIKKEPSENIDSIAKDLFQKGSYEIRYLFYASVDKDYTLDTSADKKEVGNIVYTKTNTKYEEVEKRYGEIFTDEALINVLGMRFLNVNGSLYLSTGQGSKWDINNLSVEKANEENGTYTYKATFEDKEENSDNTVLKTKTCMFKIKKEGETYKICETNYLGVDSEIDLSNLNESIYSLKIFIGNKSNTEVRTK